MSELKIKIFNKDGEISNYWVANIKSINFNIKFEH